MSDQLVERAKKIGIEEAWQILQNEGYKNQYEGNWKMVHDHVPVVGRSVTARFIPSRPDLETQIKERGKLEGRKGNTNAWPIEILQKGDVYVAEAFVRDFHPSFLEDVVLGGLNTPILIGAAIVMPGDLIISEREVSCSFLHIWRRR